MDAIREREMGLIDLFCNCDSLHVRSYAQALCYSPKNETCSGGEYPEYHGPSQETDKTG